MIRSVAVRPVSRLVSVLAVLVAVVLLPVAPASAHDVVTGTNPEDGQSLDAVPEAIEVSFSNAPLSMGSEILIKDAAGTNWAEGGVEIDGNMAVQPVNPEAPAGEYTVTWRVVSSDSHPIDGSFSFTATDGAGASSSPNPEQAGAGSSQPAQPVAEPAAPEQPQAETQQAAADEADTGVPLSFVIVLALLVIAPGLVVVAVVARRRRLESDEA
ncbi:copper resistance CopC family protein [Brevibacterium luteolum]|uniref:copper resistance CopC family protein n=1 Tax=Brevibacterium luteolum TaxID=199591 RepID=UPI0020B36D6B|nr:copper resistance CopC family protein [Brevibacterium luteolum]